MGAILKFCSADNHYQLFHSPQITTHPYFGITILIIGVCVDMYGTNGHLNG